jgi:hypothetical protein
MPSDPDSALELETLYFVGRPHLVRDGEEWFMAGIEPTLNGAWNNKMPCGHLRQYGTLGEVFPVHCLACENEWLRQTVQEITFYAYQPATVREAIDTLVRDE